LDDVGVANGFHNFDFAFDSLPVVFIFEGGFVYDFDGDVLAGGHVDGSFYFSEGAASKGFCELVVT
jgi:hypothetical protein